MQELLFLAHRIPYPPDKGDKIRSWHFLEHLARRYRVHLGCFVDDPRDLQFEPFLRELCHECCFVRLDPRVARWRSLRGLLDRRPLTLPYYFDRRMARWVGQILMRREVSRVFAYCSAMAQYVPGQSDRPLRRIVDFVDLDSEKWCAYAERVTGLKAWLFNREGRTLRQIERQVASRFDMTLFATAAEADQFRGLAPELGRRISTVANGIDATYFSPERSYENPYDVDRIPLVFTGAMDYWPNAEAVTYFARSILPAVRERLPDVSFFIVGSNPTPEVTALASGRDIVVTGRVPDVRPYTAHARVVVAPLRLGRGVQNKVLEGMAMAKPVVATPQALEGIDARIGTDILLGDGDAGFAAAICAAAEPENGDRIGRNARQLVITEYAWCKSLDRLDSIVDGVILAP